MGFIDGVGRFLAGKPVFEPGDGTSQPQNQPPDQGQPQSGPKEIPLVNIDRIEVNERGNDFTLDLFIKNNASVEIFVDKVSVFGATREVDYTLRPGEMREFHDFYKGQKFNHSNYNRCEVYYRTLQGDNFMTNHVVEYQSKGDGIYDIKNIKFVGPVKDLYGNN